MNEQEYEVVVIGAGPVGENVADATTRAGLRTVIVEHELVGGECSYWACMPSKTLLRTGAALRAARAVAGAWEAVTGDLDVPAVLERRTAFTHDWDDASQVDWLAGAGIDLVRGRGRLAGPRRVEVAADTGETVVLSATRAVVVCTGSLPSIPDIPGLAESRPWTSRDATSATRIPSRLAVIGGGVVAAEMATAYSDFGSHVDVVSRSGMLARFEPFAAEQVTASLRERGVTIRTGVSPVSVHRTDGEHVALELDDGSEVVADEVLVATGRRPATDGLGLETVGLTDGDWLTVDDSMVVRGADGETIDGLYAAGDVNHRALLTHQGKYQGRAAGSAIVARASGAEGGAAPWTATVATADHEAVPQVVFSDPEVASVGLTAAAAEEAGHRTRVVDYAIGDVAGAAVQADGYRGQARAIVDEDRQILLGVTFVGPEVAELLHAATIAVVGQVPLARLWHAVPAYPTVSEVWLRLLETYGRESA